MSQLITYGRGRGRLLSMLNNPPSLAKGQPTTDSSPIDIKDLFNSERSSIEVYKMLKRFILAQPFNKDILRTCIEMLFKNMIENPINAAEICKSLYVFSCYYDKTIGREVWKVFFNTLEARFQETQNEFDKIDQADLRRFTKFFITAVHFMRNPTASPKEDIIAAIIILINRLNNREPVNADIHLYSQAVAWISTYMKISGLGSVLRMAYFESLDQLRIWMSEGFGGPWTLACIEYASNEGSLPNHAIKFYHNKLNNSQFLILSECCLAITVPAQDKGMYLLPNFNCITYFDE